MGIPLRVLWVEDQQDEIVLMMRELRRHGYEVTYKRVETAEAMEAMLDNERFDIIISDHTMPNFSGFAALKLYKEKGLDIPFIIVSGTVTEEMAVAAMKGGAHDYIMKDNLARLGPAVERELREAEVRLEHKRAEEKLRQSYEKLQKTLEGTISALAATSEMRDPYTAGHQERTTQLACAIAIEMDMPEAAREGIRMAGTIHDLGKIYVPIDILNKPGRLSDMELGIIKTHPQVGYDILRNIDFPWPIAQIVYQHHERTDGSGYPLGLSGESILLEARILGIADVVEAMSSHRPYRPALGIDKALEEISRGRGILYDADVVDVCLKVFTEKGFKFENG